MLLLKSLHQCVETGLLRTDTLIQVHVYINYFKHRITWIIEVSSFIWFICITFLFSLLFFFISSFYAEIFMICQIICFVIVSYIYLIFFFNDLHFFLCIFNSCYIFVGCDITNSSLSTISYVYIFKIKIIFIWISK